MTGQFCFNNIFKILIGAFLVLMFFSIPASRAEPLRIATLDLMPYGFIDSKKKTVGVLFDLGSKIAEEAGFSFSNEIYPFARILKMMEDGRVDIAITSPHKSMEEVAVPIAEVCSAENIVIGPKGTEFNSLKDLHGKTIGVVRGANYDDAFYYDTAIKKYPIGDYTQGIKLIFAKRIDGMAGPELGILFEAFHIGYKEEDFGKPLLLNAEWAWLFYSKKTVNDEKMEKLKATIVKLLQNGTVQQIMEDIPLF